MEGLLVAICDDSTTDEDRIKEFVDASPVPSRSALYTNTADFMEDFVPGLYDLVLMDIYMRNPDGTEDARGVEAVTAIRAIDPTVPIAFTTTSTEFALEGYRLGVNSYLEKPVRREDVDALMRAALEAKAAEPGVTLRANGVDQRVPARQVVYAEQAGHNVTVHLVGGREVVGRARLADLEAQLDPQVFVRCHKSYLANLTFVEAVDEDLMVLRMRWGGVVHVRRSDVVRTRRAWEDRMFKLAQARGGQG